MVFSSLTFLFLFFPLVFIVYYLMPNRKLKNVFLMIVSLVFYAWGEPIYILLMVFSTLNDYTAAILLDTAKKRGQFTRARLFLAGSVTVNLSLLGFFKYSGFLIDNINTIFDLQLHLHDLPLPIGISFYTFQTMSYTIDVYLGGVKVQKNLLLLGTYVTLFPQLIAGPIVRYATVEEELINRQESVELIALGLRRFIIGLGKKVLIANQMGIIADTLFNVTDGNPGTFMVWIGLFAYTFQIYFDFSGYSDMAIGIGKMFGFHFLENFNYPYVSKSVTEFWRRWHISLGTWFKEYVYIPLGGNRKHPVRNIFIVWLLTGIWHGAYWNYMIWGVYFGVLLMIEKYWIKKWLEKLPNILQHVYALFFIVMGWLIFRNENINELVYFGKRLFVYEPMSMNQFFIQYNSILYALPFFALAIIGSTPLSKKIRNSIEESGNWIVQTVHDGYLVLIFGSSIIFLLGSTFNPFIYFRF